MARDPERDSAVHPAKNEKSGGAPPDSFMRKARSSALWPRGGYEHPVVEPQVSHFRQVPLRTSVKFAHSGQASPT